MNKRRSTCTSKDGQSTNKLRISNTTVESAGISYNAEKSHLLSLITRNNSLSPQIPYVRLERFDGDLNNLDKISHQPRSESTAITVDRTDDEYGPRHFNYRRITATSTPVRTSLQDSESIDLHFSDDISSISYPSPRNADELNSDNDQTEGIIHTILPNENFQISLHLLDLDNLINRTDKRFTCADTGVILLANCDGNKFVEKINNAERSQERILQSDIKETKSDDVIYITYSDDEVICVSDSDDDIVYISD